MSNQKNDQKSDCDLSELFSLWTVQDSLLQYYRTIFIASESLLLAISATLIDDKGLAIFALILVGFPLLYVWVNVTNSRARDVTFTQVLIKCAESGRCVSKPLTIFKEYQEIFDFHRGYLIVFDDETHEYFKPKKKWPSDFRIQRWKTRYKMELVLPIVFGVSWLIITCLALMELF